MMSGRFSLLRRFSPQQVLVCGFAGMILAGSLLLRLPAASASGQPFRYLDALFTATSAVCVTGMEVVDTGTDLSFFGQLVVLFLIQFGGLGFMTLSTALALLIGKRIGLKERVLLQEAYNQLDLSGLVQLVRKILWVTLALESCGALLLYFRFSSLMDRTAALYYAVFHAVSAFCNAGFALFSRVDGSGLSAFAGDWRVCLVLAALVLAGGLGFPVLSDLKKGVQGRGRLSLHSRLVLLVTLALMVSGFVLILLLEYNNPGTLGGQPAAAKAFKQ